jgi:hypothetical protein
MSFENKLKKFVSDMISKGEYIIRDNEVVFVIDLSGDDRYIYSAGDKWRVIVPRADDPSEKISVGYFESKEQARHQRDAYIAAQNKEHGEKAFDKAKKGELESD